MFLEFSSRGFINHIRLLSSLKKGYRKNYPNRFFKFSKKGYGIRMKIIKRAATEVENGMNVNLGIDISTLLPSVLPSDVKINLQS